MWIIQNSNGNVTLSQKAYAQCMLSCFNMSYCTLLSIPLLPGISLSIDDCPVTLQKINEMKSTPYFKALGSLMWLLVAICPDLSFTVNILSCFSYNPKKPHWNTLKHTMVYMKGTIDYGITYRGGANLNLIGYMLRL